MQLKCNGLPWLAFLTDVATRHTQTSSEWTRLSAGCDKKETCCTRAYI